MYDAQDLWRITGFLLRADYTDSDDRVDYKQLCLDKGESAEITLIWGFWVTAPVTEVHEYYFPMATYWVC